MDFCRKVEPTRVVSEKTGGENISPFRRSVGGGSAKLGGFGVYMCVLCGAGPHAQGVRMRYPVSRADLGPHPGGRPSPATVHASPRGFLRLIGTPYARARVEKIGALALKPACACPVRSVCLMCKDSGRHAPTAPCRMSWGGGGGGVLWIPLRATSMPSFRQGRARHHNEGM